MTHENQPLEARSPFARGPRRAVRRISRIFPATAGRTTPAGQSVVADLRVYRQIRRPVVLDRPNGDDGECPTSSAEVTWWRAATATASGWMMKMFGVAARGEAGFSGLLLAAASWIAAEILEGCATYAEAMYPIALESSDRPDPMDQHKSDIEDSRRAQIIVLRGDRCG